jgi:hypothetical protein
VTAITSLQDGIGDPSLSGESTMSFKVLQQAVCTKACSNCPNARNNRANCDGRTACAGYGSSANCPPLVVLAVVEFTLRALAAANLPAFGSSLRSSHA